MESDEKIGTYVTLKEELDTLKLLRTKKVRELVCFSLDLENINTSDINRVKLNKAIKDSKSLIDQLDMRTASVEQRIKNAQKE